MGKHYVPQEYLRGFSVSIERRDTWMFDKARRSWSFAAIKKVAQTDNYYSPEIEARLAKEVEGPGHAALNSLRNGQELSAQERDDLAYYIAVLIMRGPRKRRKAWELVPSVIDTTVTGYRNELADLRTETNAHRIDHVLTELEQVERTYREDVPATVKELVEAPWPSGQVIAAIRAMAWRVVHIPHDRFLLTTDNPAHFFASYGVGTDEAEVTFPIDSKTVLLGSHQGVAGSTTILRGNVTLTKEVNRRVASGAERFLFSPRRVNWIETLAMKADPPLRRIAW